MINGLLFPKVPDFVANLTCLEEHLVSRIVPFMQIRDLMPHALNPQLGIKGSVVNIPVNMSNNMQTIQLKFKRNLQHRSHYILFLINLTKERTNSWCKQFKRIGTQNYWFHWQIHNMPKWQIKSMRCLSMPRSHTYLP